VIALVIRERCTRKRANETVHVSAVITLLLERSLYIGDDLVGRQVIISVDGAVPGILRVGIIAPGREPITGVPVIRGAEHERDVVTIMVVPPALIVPL